MSNPIEKALAEIKEECKNLPPNWSDADGKKLIRLWSENIPFGARPEQIFFHDMGKLTDAEISRRFYLIFEWYKLWPGTPAKPKPNKLETPRAKALEILLREFSRTEELIE